MAEQNSEILWKKGTKVVRIYGSNSHGSPNAMNAGDVDELLEDQEFPGTLPLKKFKGHHDPIRFRRLQDYEEFTPKELSDLWYLVGAEKFEDTVDFIKKMLNKKDKEWSDKFSTRFCLERDNRSLVRANNKLKKEIKENEQSTTNRKSSKRNRSTKRSSRKNTK